MVNDVNATPSTSQQPSLDPPGPSEAPIASEGSYHAQESPQVPYIGTPNAYPWYSVHGHQQTQYYPPSYAGYYPPQQQPWAQSTSYGTSTGYSPYSVLSTNPQHLSPLSAPNPPPQAAKQPRVPTQSFEKTYHHWDEVIRAFFQELGLSQSLHAFEQDFVGMNEDWERDNVPSRLRKLLANLQALGNGDGKGKEKAFDIDPEPPLDDRKTRYFTLSDGSAPRTPSTITKSISQFLAKQRSKNNISNRSEFLLSLAEKRKRQEENDAVGDVRVKRRKLDNEEEEEEESPVSTITSCARTDAKFVNRDMQMKFDIAKNEEGPLSRTVKPVKDGSKPQDPVNGREPTTSLRSATQDDDDQSTTSRHPGLAQRVESIEDHFAVKYVPSPPRTLLMRLKLLEDHIMKLEKDYPPWAALHFNQPRRGWPPPPRPTPIIVPLHQRAIASSSTDSSTSQPKSDSSATPSGPPRSSPGTEPTIPGGSRNSSLRRAVLQKLEVQKAMSDLGGS